MTPLDRYALDQTRRAMLRAWARCVAVSDSAELEAEIVATRSAMRQIAALAKRPAE